MIVLKYYFIFQKIIKPNSAKILLILTYKTDHVDPSNRAKN